MPETAAALPAHASVVVVGGGVMGCSTLYHLAKAGASDAILLERNQEVGMKPIATALEEFLQDFRPVGSNSISPRADIQ